MRRSHARRFQKLIAQSSRLLSFPVRKFWQGCTLNNIFVAIIFIDFGFMLILAVILSFDVFSIWRDNPNSENFYESVRNLTFAIGGVGAAIGLWLANQRQKALSKQVQV